jgi:hypothetical protein
MLALFRINDPLRLVLVALLLIVARSLAVAQGLPLSVDQLLHLTLGERLSQGATMYAHVWDPTAPLSAGGYWLLVWAFGKGALPFQVLAVALVIFQASFWNRLLLRLNLYNEKNYLPAFLYALFFLLSPDLLELSPPLIALTFLLLLAHRVFSLRDRPQDSSFFAIGAYAGLAALSYLPSATFVGFALLGSAFMRTLGPRQVAQVLFGTGFVVALVAGYYFWRGHLVDLIQNYFATLTWLAPELPLSLTWLVGVMAVPLVGLVVAIVRVYSERAFVNFQVSCQNLMLFWLICAVPSLPLGAQVTPVSLVVLAPPVSFFMAHWFLLIRKKSLAELLFLGYLGCQLAVSYFAYLEFKRGPAGPYARLVAPPAPAVPLQGTQLLVLGQPGGYYQGNTLATPYLNWRLATQHFNHLDYYVVMTAVYENFRREPPHYLVDGLNLAPKLFDQLPLLAQMYQPGPQPGVYQLRPEFLPPKPSTAAQAQP